MSVGACTHTRAWLAGMLGLLMIGPGAISALAASAPGNILDPSGRDTTRVVDPQGLSWLRPARHRTPTGFLYPYPLEPQTLRELNDSWKVGLSFDLGGLETRGDDDETRFWRYADWDSSLLVRSFRLALLETQKGLFAEVQGGGADREDQFYLAELSWLGRARLRGSYSGVPRTYALDARTLYDGVGTDTLRLIPGLTPGGDPAEDGISFGFSQGSVTDQQLIAALGTVGASRLSVQRNDARGQLDVWLRPDTRLFASYRSMERKGTRPFGGSWLYLSDVTSRAVQTIEPISDRTHELSVGLALSVPRILDANLSYTSSFYRNQNESLTWDNPFLVSGFSPSEERRKIKEGRFALAPDNEWHNLRGDLVVPVPLDGRLAATASWSRMQQDEELLPPTVNTGTLPGLDLNKWNSQSALSQSSAATEVETLLLRGDLRLRPSNRLQLGAQVRYFERDDKSHYTACNPDTGEAGYVTEDGALAVAATGLGLSPHQLESTVCGGSGTLGPGNMEDFRYRTTPYGYDQLEAEASMGLRLQPKTKLELRYAWQRKHYERRERDHTTTKVLRAALSSRHVGWVTTRISYEYQDRDGSPYDFDPYRADFASSLPEFNGPERAFTLAQFRKYDLADRKLQRANLRANFLVRPDMDLAVTGQLRDTDFGSEYGVQYERGAGASVEWNWQSSPNTNAYLLGSWEYAQRKTSSITGSFGAVDPNAGGPGYRLDRQWQVQSHQYSGLVGLGFRARISSRWTLETRYSLAFTRQQIDFDYATTLALANPSVSEGEAGNDFPLLETLDQSLETSLRYQISEFLALRVFYLYWYGKVDDFQQTGLDDPELVEQMCCDPFDPLAPPPFGAGTLFLGHVDRDYSTHMIGATVQLRY